MKWDKTKGWWFQGTGEGVVGAEEVPGEECLKTLLVVGSNSSFRRNISEAVTEVLVLSHRLPNASSSEWESTDPAWTILTSGGLLGIASFWVSFEDKTLKKILITA